jgi:hypothetical protein
MVIDPIVLWLGIWVSGLLMLPFIAAAIARDERASR